jgi:hypothetical protein
VQHPGMPADRGARGGRSGARARRLHADQPHLAVAEERIEEAHRVRAAADAGHQHVGEPSELPPHLAADHRLEVPHHHRVRMGTAVEPTQ